MVDCREYNLGLSSLRSLVAFITLGLVVLLWGYLIGRDCYESDRRSNSASLALTPGFQDWVDCAC